MSHIKGAL